MPKIADLCTLRSPTNGQHRIILTASLVTRAAKCGPYVRFSTEFPSRCPYPHATKDAFGRQSWY
jgi:hypothetical protein